MAAGRSNAIRGRPRDGGDGLRFESALVGDDDLHHGRVDHRHHDVFEPGILNTGETVEILIRVNPVVAAATTNLAIIGTEKGVTVQTYFAGPP